MAFEPPPGDGRRARADRCATRRARRTPRPRPSSAARTCSSAPRASCWSDWRSAGANAGARAGARDARARRHARYAPCARAAGNSGRLQRVRMEPQVILDEAGDEEVPMVVALVAAQRQRLPGGAARGLEARRRAAARPGTCPPAPGRPAAPARARLPRPARWRRAPPRPRGRRPGSS